MIYLDNGATSFHKPPQVERAVIKAMRTCANPGRGGYDAAIAAARMVYACREQAAKFFDCQEEQVVFTSNCTHGLNIAIRSLVKPRSRVVISGFEHNAVTRPLYAIGAHITVAGRRLFEPQDTLEQFTAALKKGADVAVFTHTSNVFGYVLPVEEMAHACRLYGVPFIIDAAQSAGVLPVRLKAFGADFIAMPGHKGLLGPQGTGLLLCAHAPLPLMQGGTGSLSKLQEMPDFLPDVAEPGTLNVPGIAGLCAALSYLHRVGINTVRDKERNQAKACAQGLQALGFRVFFGQDQTGTVSFVGDEDCEAVASKLAARGIAVRSGLHCAPLAHESAGTLGTGTVRVSFGHDACCAQTQALLRALKM